MKFVWIAGSFMFAFIAAAILSKWLEFPHLTLVFATVASLTVAAMFYRMRCRSRVTYGLLELALAIGFFYFLLRGMQESAAIKTVELIEQRMLTMFAAIYFMVRAFDNIGQGLTGDKALRWKKLFEGK